MKWGGSWWRCKDRKIIAHWKTWRELEERLGRDVDLVEEGTLLPFAVESANRDKKLVYKRTN
jgi:hypothetical protein